MIESLRKLFFYKSLANVSKRNAHKTDGLNEAKTIGILFDQNSTSYVNDVELFGKKLLQNGSKDIFTLSFISNNKPKNQLDTRDIFYKSDLNWYGVPRSKNVDDFIKQPFDILIILCNRYLPVFEYILSHSKAVLKIGPWINNSHLYLDMSIEMKNAYTIQHLIDAIVLSVNKIAIKEK